MRCPKCGAVVRGKGPQAGVGVRLTDRRPSGCDLLAQAHLVLCALAVLDVDRDPGGDRRARLPDPTGTSLGVSAGRRRRSGCRQRGPETGRLLVRDHADRHRTGTPISDPARLDGVSAVGVDETSFLSTTGQHPTLCATVISDLTPRRPAWLLDVVARRSGTVLAD